MNRLIFLLILSLAGLGMTSCESDAERQARQAEEGLAEMNRRLDQFKADGDFIRRVEADPNLNRADKDQLIKERIEIGRNRR